MQQSRQNRGEMWILGVCARFSRCFSGMESLSFRDKFDSLLEKRPGGVAGLRYTMLYGKSLTKYFVGICGNITTIEAENCGNKW